MSIDYRFIRPIGMYLPLIWTDDIFYISSLSRVFFILANLVLRFISYPFSFVINACITSFWVFIATFFNVGCLLGGYFSSYWSQKTKQFNQIAIVRCQWLLLDVPIFVWYQLQLFLGLLNTEYYFRTLETLKDLSEEIIKTKLHQFDWQIPHYKVIKRLHGYLCDHSFYVTSKVVCTLASEPVDAIYFGLNFFYGMGKPMSYYGLNPSQLTTSQANCQPVLLLHGNLHNQSAWLPLAAFLHSKKYEGPIFTVNLPSHAVTETDYEIIENKLNEIKQLYVRKNIFDVKTTLIGHSRGAGLAYSRFCNSKRFALKNTHNTSKENASVAAATPVTVDKVILMGCGGYNGCFFIRARHDILVPTPDNTQDTVVDTGHLGLIANPKALERCYEILKM